MHPQNTTSTTGPRQPDSRRRLADFDEQLWPVNLLLLLFAACLAGVIIVKSDFAAPRWLENGWFQLAALAAIVAALAWSVVWLEGRVQRRMQFGVFLSLLVHLWLCLVSYNLHMSAIAQRDRDVPEEFDEPAPVTLPDYQWQDEATNDASDPTLETPVETATPETEQEVERTEPVEKPQEKPAEREPEPRPIPMPAAVERAEMSAPRRAEELAGQQLSRQERRVAETNEQAALPRVNETQEKAFDAAVNVERARLETSQNRPDAAATLADSRPSAAAMTRQPTRENTPDSETASMARQQQVAASDRPAAVAIERVREMNEAAPQLTPGKVQLQQAEAEPRVARRSQPVRESPNVTADSSATRSERATVRGEPRVDSRATAKLAKAATQSDAPDISVPTQKPEATTRTDAIAAARVDAVSRSTASLPDAATTAANAPSASETNKRTPFPAEMTAAARAASSEPSVHTPSVAASRRTAAAAIGDAAAQEISAASPSTANEQKAAQPSSAALTKASGGAVGLTRQQQFDTEAPDMSASATAQSAARRAQATQTFDAGAATAPSQPAQIAKARAGAEIPAAAMHAESVTVADMAGSKQPAMREASSSAAAQRVAAAVPRGRVTAAAGSGTLDQGMPQISSPIGAGRTSGGGLPSLSGGELAAKLAKATDLAGASGASAPVMAEAPREITGANTSLAASTSGVERMSSSEPRSLRTDGFGSTPSSSGTASSAAEVEGRRGEAAPTLTTELASAMAGRAHDTTTPVDGGAEAPDVPQIVAGAAGSTGENEAISASDFDRQSPAAMPSLVRNEFGGAAGAGSHVAVSETSRRSNDDLPGSMAASGGTLRGRTAAAAIVASDIAVSDVAGGAVAESKGPRTSTLAANLPSERQAPALPMLAAAPPGAGGLGPAADVEPGVPSRRARPESEVAHLNTGRLILERSGANRAAEVRVQDVAVPGFKQRDRQLREALARQRGGSEGSERAVEMGLDFLARHQNVDGSWSLQNFSQGRPGYEGAGDGQMVSDTAATGLAMLAFFGAGYTHTDGKYRLAVGRGLSYLLGNQKPDGDLFLPQETKSNLNVWLYSHGIASIALCEAYGMTRDPTLRQPAQKAIDFIVASQHPTEGGWRYAPRQGSDTSVSGWQLMAMKSGELAGLQVPAATYAKVSRWLDGAQSPLRREQYVYRPKSTRDHQRTASRVMTAEALLMRQYLGWKRDNAAMTAGADYLMTQLPEWSAGTGWQRDSYYWYYATQVMFQMGGPHWDAWNERLRPLLVEKQVAEGPLAGSWEPQGDVPDRWGHEGGRIYVTAVHLLMLEVYYRHLPLYQTLEGEP